LRVLLVTISLDAERGGGTAERTRRLALGLAALGTPCEVVAMEGGTFADDLRQAAIPVHVTGSIRLKFDVPTINPFSFYRLVRRADRIHVLGYWNLLSVATTRLARMLGRPYVLSPAGEFAGLVQPRPISRVFHRLFGVGMVRGAASLLAITALERRQIMERFGSLAPDIFILPNGVPDPTDASVPPPQGRKIVLFVGRLAPIKGPDLLLEAFASVALRHPDVQLVLAGPDFGLRDQLAGRIVELGLQDRAVLTGYVDEDRRAALFGSALFLCVPSRAEAMSLIGLEAGAAGLPLLLTDQCGFDEVAEIGGGAVVPASVDGLAAGLDRLLTERSELAAMGERLRAHIRDNYTWPRLAAMFRDRLAALRPFSPRGLR
jgi:glycosyltransferase involved in cell wall biosynthesis